jgi:hypothetical protein
MSTGYESPRYALPLLQIQLFNSAPCSRTASVRSCLRVKSIKFFASTLKQTKTASFDSLLISHSINILLLVRCYVINGDGKTFLNTPATQNNGDDHVDGVRLSL